jgi:acylphosphatase
MKTQKQKQQQQQQQQQKRHILPGGISNKPCVNVYTAIFFLLAVLFIFKFTSSISDGASSTVVVKMTTTTTFSKTEAEIFHDGTGGFAFEIHGKVQGVFFRKYTQKQARKIGDLVGWIRNTETGTVEGEVASRSLEKRQSLQTWLRTTGSPKSKIDKADFQELPVSRVQELLHELDDFIVKKTTKR